MQDRAKDDRFGAARLDMVRQVQRITQTVNRLRARLQKRPPRFAPCDLPTLVAELRPLLEQMLAPLDVAFTLHWQGQPRPLPLDGTGMEQLLVNLIKNGAESAAQRAAQRAAKSARPAVHSPAHPPKQLPAQEPARVELLIAFEAQSLLLEIRDNGALGQIYAHLLSLNGWERLIAIAAVKALKAGQPQAANA